MHNNNVRNHCCGKNISSLIPVGFKHFFICLLFSIENKITHGDHDSIKSCDFLKFKFRQHNNSFYFHYTYCYNL